MRGERVEEMEEGGEHRVLILYLVGKHCLAPWYTDSLTQIVRSYTHMHRAPTF